MISMSESNLNSNSPDVANSLGQDKTDVVNATPEPSSSADILDDFDKPLVDDSDKPLGSPSMDKHSSTSEMVSMPSLSSFNSLGGDEGEGSVAYSSEDDLEGYDYEDDEISNDESYLEPPQPEASNMPIIPGLEVSKDARPGRFLAELAVSADSLVNKNTPEKELGARWKDGSIPIAMLVKQQEKLDKDAQEKLKEKLDDQKARGRRNSGRRRLRSKSPPRPKGGRNEVISDDNSSDDDVDFGVSSIVPPSRPTRQVSVELPPMSPVPGGMFSPTGPFAGMGVPVKPERKVSMNLASANMAPSTNPLITPPPGTQGGKTVKTGVGKSLPSIDLSHQDNITSPTSLPPLKPMRQTTRNLFDSVVETISEDYNIAEENTNGEETTNAEEDDVHPILEGKSDQVSSNDTPSQPQRRETYFVDSTPLPSQPQRRETFYDDALPLEAVEENFDDAENPEADEAPNVPLRTLGERRVSTRRFSLIEDE